MSDSPFDQFDDQLRPILKAMVREGTHHAVGGLSEMVDQTITVSQPTVSLVPLNQISNLLSESEHEVVGLFQRVEGEMASQIMLVSLSIII